MYSKQEATQLKQEFWTAFGRYMEPVLSAESTHINWINYKTGKKNIYFRMNADSKKASVAIEITHKDVEMQALYFEQFRQLKVIMQDALQEDWIWLLHSSDEQAKTVSRIYIELVNVNIFNKSDWPQLISFFKPRIITLDKFWSNARHFFDLMC